MTTGKINLIIMKISAVVVLLLGVIHNVATFLPIISDMLQGLNTETYNFVIFMSLGTGTSLLFSGLLILVMLNDFKRNALYILIVIANMIITSVIMAVYLGVTANPFAGMMLVASVVLLVNWSLLKLKKETPAK